MVYNGLLLKIYQFVLDEYMGSNPQKMAFELRMSERTLNAALCKERSPEYAVLFEQLLTYCARHYIGVDSVLREYNAERH